MINSWEFFDLIFIKHNEKVFEFESLDQAMDWAKALGEFVTIHANGLEIVGKFGADGISDGKFPNGDPYTWKKRRRTWLSKKLFLLNLLPPFLSPFSYTPFGKTLKGIEA